MNEVEVSKVETKKYVKIASKASNRNTICKITSDTLLESDMALESRLCELEAVINELNEDEKIFSITREGLFKIALISMDLAIFKKELTSNLKSEDWARLIYKEYKKGHKDCSIDFFDFMLKVYPDLKAREVAKLKKSVFSAKNILEQ